MAFTIDPVPAVPWAPQITAVSLIAPTSVKVEWNRMGYIYPALIEWQIMVSTNSSFSTWHAAIGGFTTDYKTVPGLAINTRWYFRVRGKNAEGWGAWSNTVSFLIPNIPATMAAPTLSLMGEPTDVSVAIVAPSNGGAGITHFTIQWGIGATYASPKSKDVTYAEYVSGPTTINDISPGVLMYFRVIAWNSQGRSNWSPNATIELISGPSVKVDTEYERTVCYVKFAGTYRIAIPYVKESGVWRLADG